MRAGERRKPEGISAQRRAAFPERLLKAAEAAAAAPRPGPRGPRHEPAGRGPLRRGDALRAAPVHGDEARWSPQPRPSPTWHPN